MAYRVTKYAATGTTEPCEHNHGWYYDIPFWIFSRRIFICSDCTTMLYGKKLTKWEA